MYYDLHRLYPMLILLPFGTILLKKLPFRGSPKLEFVMNFTLFRYITYHLLLGEPEFPNSSTSTELRLPKSELFSASDFASNEVQPYHTRAVPTEPSMKNGYKVALASLQRPGNSRKERSTDMIQHFMEYASRAIMTDSTTSISVLTETARYTRRPRKDIVKGKAVNTTKLHPPLR